MLRRKEEAFESRRVIKGGTGEIRVRDKFKPEEMFGKCAMWAEFVMAPGQAIGMHTHEKDMDIFYVLSGTLVAVNNNGDEETIHPGDSVLTGGGESHALRNDSQEEAVLLVFVSP